MHTCVRVGLERAGHECMLLASACERVCITSTCMFVWVVNSCMLRDVGLYMLCAIRLIYLK